MGSRPPLPSLMPVPQFRPWLRFPPPRELDQGLLPRLLPRFGVSAAQAPSGLRGRGQADALAIDQPALLTVLMTVGAQVGRAGEDAGLDGSRRAPREDGGQQQEQGESKLSELQERFLSGP